MSPLTERLLDGLGSVPVDSLPAAVQPALRLWQAAGCPDCCPPGADFPAWLNRKRRSKLISLDDLGGMVKLSRTSLSRLESGERKLTAGEWLKIAGALSLTQEEREEGEKLLRKQG